MWEGIRQSPLILVYVFLALWVATFALIRVVWRRTQAGKEWREYRARLSRAILRRVISMQWVILIVTGVAVLLAAVQARRIFHPGEIPGQASALAVTLIVVSSYMIASYITAWLTNVVWWLTPSMQEAAAAARAGLGAVTRRNAILLLLLQGLILIPICLAQIYFGLVMQ